MPRRVDGDPRGSNRPGGRPDWELYRALREQWTHEDNLVNHRLMWLILSEGLLFTAYGTVSAAELRWLVFGFPLLGVIVTALIGVSIFAAFAAAGEIGRHYQEAGLDALFSLTPGRRFAARGRRAVQALLVVFGAVWLLAFASAFAS